MLGLACYTCFGQGPECKGFKCGHYTEIPQVVICPECAQKARPKSGAANLLLCEAHPNAKPAVSVLKKALEAWIPNLDLGSLGVALQIN